MLEVSSITHLPPAPLWQPWISPDFAHCPLWVPSSPVQTHLKLVIWVKRCFSKYWQLTSSKWEASWHLFTAAAAAAAKSLQSCPTLCDPIGVSPPGSLVPGILQARTLEWVAISFSTAWKWKVKVKLLSRVRLFATPWTAAYQAPPSMGFSRLEYWSGVPLPSPTSSLGEPKKPFF